jgi:prephenate dehydrogenase
MTVQITVIGLGQIGTSIGLALSGREELVHRTGHDREMAVMNKAKSLKAFDATQYNLPTSVEKADLVALCLPFDQVEETLKHIGPDLREGAVVLDMSPLKSVVAGWFEKYVPAGRHYIGLVPAINPLMLMETGRGIDAARADLFDKATIGIAAPMNVRPEAVKLAEDLVKLLGGQPLFLDLLEADGMMMTAHVLPQVIAAGVLNATVGQPGWDEARRFAGRPYAQVAGVLGDDTLDALKQLLLLNSEKTVHSLDQVIGALTHLRNAVRDGDSQDLEKRLHLAFDDQSAWLQERSRAKWDKDEKQKVELNNPLQRLFVGSRPKKK